MALAFYDYVSVKLVGKSFDGILNYQQKSTISGKDKTFEKKSEHPKTVCIQGSADNQNLGMVQADQKRHSVFASMNFQTQSLKLGVLELNLVYHLEFFGQQT